ncbi:MAG: Retroviral aspartyl protease [Candidatus Nezhaarchaeota archaeon]|nr:Retroviral aspartyl protease [Candidatus Nezhaarchaeota archaeon]
MGFVRVKARVWNIESPGDVREVVLLADTGAIYTVLPGSFLRSLGVKSIGRRKFRLANNQVLEREVGIIGVEVNGIKTHSIAIFGDEGVYLLGVVTLEELGLEVDPVRGELRPLELLLMQLGYPLAADR